LSNTGMRAPKSCDQDPDPLARFDLPMREAVHIARRERPFDRDKELAIREGSVASTHRAPAAGVTLINAGFRWKLGHPEGPLFLIDGGA
jgi:hypothetical protein